MKKSFFKYIALLILLFSLSAFNFCDVMVGSWNPQYIYNTNGQSIRDMAFADSLTGYIIMRSNTTGEGTIIKTTNGGNNWSYSYHTFDSSIFTNINVFNKDSCLVCNAYRLFKTTNGGGNWSFIDVPDILGTFCIEAFNFDTIWAGVGTGFHQPQLYLTTNGGVNWILKFQESLSSGLEFDRIYFYNKRIGFCCTASNTYKTTNGGDNWFQIMNQPFLKIEFIDSLVGWKCSKSDYLMKKTTDGGYTWITQTLPSGSQFAYSRMYDFSIINKDTIWGCGGMLNVIPYSFSKALIWKTTNGGENWGYQLPDTNVVKFRQYFHISFVNKNNGWIYNTDSSYLGFSAGGVHTTTGGLDSTVYVGINESNLNITKGFILYQNYPNPFNPTTSIRYKVESIKQIKIVVFDILGREVKTLVNEKQKAGEYEVQFNAVSISSGIYYYALYADGVRMDARKMVLLK